MIFLRLCTRQFESLRFVNFKRTEIGQLIVVMAFLTLVLSACQEGKADPTPITIVVTGESGEEVIVTRVVRQTVQVETTPVIEEVSIPVELDVPLIGSIGLLDPHATDDDNALELIENLYAGLTRFDHASTVVEPELAADWEVSEDGLVWTFRLRDDIYWIEQGGGSPGVLAIGEDDYKPL